MRDELRNRIVTDPTVMTGKPVIRGTRVPVELIVRMLSQGVSEAAILQEYPRLRAEDVQASLDYAADVLADEHVFPLSA